jgi:hypothetical protein
MTDNRRNFLKLVGSASAASMIPFSFLQAHSKNVINEEFVLNANEQGHDPLHSFPKIYGME